MTERSEGNPIRIGQEIMEMAEWKLLQEIRNFYFSLEIFNRNVRELERLLEFLCDDPKGMEVFDLKNRAQFDEALKEIVRLLHNAVAAAKSLVDHSRTLVTKKYKETGKFDDYQEEVDRVFVGDPLTQFVKCLREFCQHYRMPDIQAELGWNNAEGMRRVVQLRTDDLLEFKRWNAPAKKFIEEAGDKIDLLKTIKDYKDKVNKFYRWMNERQKEIHREEIDAVEEKRKELLEANKEDVPKRMEFQLAILEKGVGSVEDVFISVLSPADFAELAKYTSEKRKWVEEALKKVESSIELGEELVKRIRAKAE